MKREVKIDWVESLEFKAEMDGHTITLDGPPEAGGRNKGVRPKPLMLLALAGCTGMDVVSILKKMRVEIDGLSIHVEGDMEEEAPNAFTAMQVVYTFRGKDLPLDKLEKAVELSKEKYCGVSAVLQKALPITYQIRVETP
ncbi:MAG: OsmC family protein [Bacteroidales bacterium]